jgi:hypothetical protein
MEDKTMVSRDYTAMYSGLLKSPWACSLEDEQKVRESLPTCVKGIMSPHGYFFYVCIHVYMRQWFLNFLFGLLRKILNTGYKGFDCFYENTYEF